jgi:hypothetical protein
MRKMREYLAVSHFASDTLFPIFFIIVQGSGPYPNNRIASHITHIYEAMLHPLIIIGSAKEVVCKIYPNIAIIWSPYPYSGL